MLTGDKVDTAISIAMSCKLITAEMNNFVIDQDLDRPLEEVLLDVLEADQPALTIAGRKGLRYQKGIEKDLKGSLNAI